MIQQHISTPAVYTHYTLTSSCSPCACVCSCFSFFTIDLESKHNLFTITNFCSLLWFLTKDRRNGMCLWWMKVTVAINKGQKPYFKEVFCKIFHISIKGFGTPQDKNNTQAERRKLPASIKFISWLYQTRVFKKHKQQRILTVAMVIPRERQSQWCLTINSLVAGTEPTRMASNMGT